ncbi:NAD(P)H-hydrate dehydratase [Niallia sp. XMNu-256]|uniref:NAD(P)H-hydrate dehydratase n=1 Tax=Niallia sp. XMNu-256 TaxID=3082444 RepID=UPI0030CDAD96
MYIYSGQQIKDVDAHAEQNGMSLFTLMENAGNGLYHQISKAITRTEKIVILAGKGNNGGDGIVLARYLKNNRYHVSLMFPLGLPKTKTAEEHLAYYEACGYDFNPFTENIRADVIIDGLLGVGSQLPLREDVLEITNWINRQQAKVIAIDVPTGVACDTGDVDDNAVKANYTYVLHGYKPSAFLYPSSHYYGQTTVIDIGILQSSRWKVWSEEEVRNTLPKRTGNTHKGTFGTGLLVAGSDEMPGSAALAAIGAIRFGIGKLSVATTRHASIFIGRFTPEATFLYEWSLTQQQAFSSMAIGPGLNPDQQLEQFVNDILNKEVPVILDAGALSPREYKKRQAPTILTPHPGEFRRLTGESSAHIQKNRIELASQFSQENGVIVVLKGEWTVIAFPDGSGVINPTGNRALSKGGTGDTLTGMLVASVHTHDGIKDAVANAVYIHGACGNKWTEQHGDQTMTAHDFDKLLPKVVYYFSN